ncbi:MAG: hypothetical protein OEZ14_05220, partial [Acidimicrobiia bacterium]|nr:hypothetical protein [Acidimicrobiia bacterium]
MTIQFVTSLDKGAFATHPDPLSGGKIKIPVTGSVWTNLYVAKYKAAQAGSAEEFCIIADLAATLLHELVHSCVTGGCRLPWPGAVLTGSVSLPITPPEVIIRISSGLDRGWAEGCGDAVDDPVGVGEPVAQWDPEDAPGERVE